VARLGSWLSRLLGRDDGFAADERVVFEDGTTGIVHWSRNGYTHVYWDDDVPREDFGGSVVPNGKLRRASDGGQAEGPKDSH
jgi:hypothetical protein